MKKITSNNTKPNTPPPHALAKQTTISNVINVLSIDDKVKLLDILRSSKALDSIVITPTEITEDARDMNTIIGNDMFEEDKE